MNFKFGSGLVNSNIAIGRGYAQDTSIVFDQENCRVNSESSQGSTANRFFGNFFLSLFMNLVWKTLFQIIMMQ